jgi:hypothetical protein
MTDDFTIPQLAAGIAAAAAHLRSALAGGTARPGDADYLLEAIEDDARAIIRQQAEAAAQRGTAEAP